MAGRILIADNSHEVRRSMREPLEADGFAVREARDVQDALTQFDARVHHVALIDVDLPGGAPALVDVVKSDPDLGLTVVIMLVDDPADSRLHDALRRGATDCLHKPVDPVEAVVRAHAALRVFELQTRIRQGNAHLHDLAAHDHLTGLLSRRFLEAHMRGHVASAKRHGHSLSVVMLDVDKFKHINDTRGHEAGDVVLRSVVKRLQSRLRTEDLLGRWGGDELVLVLPDTDLSGAVTAADALRALIARAVFHIDGERIPVTLSAGAAEWHDESVQELLRRADAALYEAKAAGRNRVAA